MVDDTYCSHPSAYFSIELGPFSTEERDPWRLYFNLRTSSYDQGQIVLRIAWGYPPPLPNPSDYLSPSPTQVKLKRSGSLQTDRRVGIDARIRQKLRRLPSLPAFSRFAS